MVHKLFFSSPCFLVWSIPVTCVDYSLCSPVFLLFNFPQFPSLVACSSFFPLRSPGFSAWCYLRWVWEFALPPAVADIYILCVLYLYFHPFQLKQASWSLGLWPERIVSLSSSSVIIKEHTVPDRNVILKTICVAELTPIQNATSRLVCVGIVF